MSQKPTILNVDRSETDENRINKALQSSDMTAICEAIGEVIRRHNVSEIARKTGLGRTSIYRSFRGQQFPNLTTVLLVLNAMDFQLKVTRRRRKGVPERSPRNE